ETSDEGVSAVALLAAELLVKPFGARQQRPIGRLLARRYLDLRQLREPLFDLRLREVRRIAEYTALAHAGGERGDLDLQRTVDVVGEAHLDALLACRRSRYRYRELADQNIVL